MDWIKYSAVFILAYLLGSISTSIITGKIKSGEDIRNHGSGNAGATNTLRTFGKGMAALVVLGDTLKAVVAVLLGRLILKDNALATYIAGVGVVLGHNFPVYFGLKGGKGIVVSATTILFADWKIGLVAIAVSIGVMAVSKFVSLGSIVGALIIIVLGLIFKHGDAAYVIFSIILGGLAIFMHRKNIVRLVKGEENKLSFSKKEGGK